MYRLWEAGIRGRLWLVVDDMMTNTTAAVRTNYGDTKQFRTKMGIIQGSVLAAILFSIFISPLSTALRPISPNILGTKIAPQLFADDGTLVATSPHQRTMQIKACIRWANRWKSVINPVKSKLLSPYAQNEDTKIEVVSF